MRAPSLIDLVDEILVSGVIAVKSWALGPWSEYKLLLNTFYGKILN